MAEKLDKSMFAILLTLVTVAASFIVYSTSQVNLSLGENVTTNNTIVSNNITIYNVSVYNSFYDNGNYYIMDFNKNLTKIDKTQYDKIVGRKKL